ncbi:MAG: PEP-CTERM sorting domain-containing protein [Phenylobacterium sp.]|uniref:PEPxxWA-CTERM sorting domain-containing protein n=1 Tax=Phenylobacterium sp. TaxID=1871053 RepID=UPI0025DD51E7|nr:PEPxxWA-CTERM sorting domain-containing protein [Phenylobacterium sp.]MBI1199944.1 PEP-CTERM sorting domain-containing protein [Phenylobacterium sp.]
MRLGYLVAAAAAALLVAPAAAQASVLTFTYKGHVSESLDNTGEFGAIGSNTLVGQAFTATFTVDLGTAGLQHASDVWYDYLYGYNAANPVTGVLQLNGHTFAIGGGLPGDYGADARTDYSLEPGCTLDCQTAMFQQAVSNQASTFAGGMNYYSGRFLNAGAYAQDGTLTGLAHTGYDLTNPPVNLSVFASIYEYVDDYNVDGDAIDQPPFTRTVTHSAEVSMIADSVTMGGVPEPASWALMIAGFGVMGTSLRARRRIAA